jgi:hypothetical protein
MRRRIDRNTVVYLLAVLMLFVCPGFDGWTAGWASKSTLTSALPNDEPDLEKACSWWRDMENIWTAVGWRDHIYRFNVWFDGTISMVMQRHKDKANGYPQAEVFFVPALQVKDKWYLTPGPDDNLVIQSWGTSPAPVLRSDWARDGFVFREEVFAHISGGGDIKTGVEPLYAWVRLSIVDRMEGLPLRDKVGFAVKINNAYMVPASMSKRSLLAIKTEESRYQGVLKAGADHYDPGNGFAVLEREGTRRLVILPGQNCEVSVFDKFPT